MRRIRPVRTLGRACWATLACLITAGTAHAEASGLETATADTALKTFSDSGQDATDALQHAVESADGLVALPAGALTISRTIVVDLTATGYRGIRGANGASRIVMAGPGPAFRIVGDHQGTADPQSFQEHTWERERFPIISDFEILGKHAEADGIELFRTVQCTIRNVLIRRCRFGIHLVERNRNFLLADSHIYDGGDTGVFLDNCNLHQVNIIGNHISYNKRAGVRQFNGDVHNIQITGNDIEYNSGSEETSGEIVLEAPDGLSSEYTIASNTIQARPENPGANISIVGSEANSPHAARAMAITGNVIGSRHHNIHMEHATRITITGNTIYGGTKLNVLLKKCRNVILSDNSIGTRPSMHAVVEEYDDGVMLTSCSDSVVSGNILSGVRHGSETEGGAVTFRDCGFCRVSDCQIIAPVVRGIHVIGGTACVISDNTIAAREAKDMRAAVAVAGDGTDHLIQNNLISGALAEPVQIADGSATSVNNTIKKTGE